MEELVHVGKTFENITYSEKPIKNREFDKCTFKVCDLSNSDFSYTKFIDCSFVGCNLAMIKLMSSGLNNISFKECKLLGVNFTECEDFLFSVKFEDCVLDYASFMYKKMPKTQFLNSSLQGTVFTKTDLTSSRFDNTNLLNAVFEKTQLAEANFLTAYNFIIDPELNYLKKAKFSMEGLPGLLVKHNLNIS
jgi:fluoroquinolone resistance protein